MVKDLRYLAKVMPKYGDAIASDVNRLKGEISLSIIANVAKRTPVDVGTARSNWHVSTAISALTRKAFSPFLSRWRPPYGPGGTLAETRNQAGAVWSASSIVGKATKAGEPLYISNNLPYIQRLNQGWSNQAPAGFVEAGINEGVNQAIKRFTFKDTESVKV